jgi:hypothetical protein
VQIVQKQQPFWGIDIISISRGHIVQLQECYKNMNF